MSSPLLAGVLVGAYPLTGALDTVEEQRFMSRLAALPKIVGLELPWGTPASNSRWDELPTLWHNVLTSIPHTMQAISGWPQYGLASNDGDGRQSAVADVRRMWIDVTRVNAAAGRLVIWAVELHSAPAGGGGRTSRESLLRAFAEIASWDWAGVRLLIEHVDADSPDAAKGFLPLETEIEVAHAHGAGVLLNWARSAIEFQDGDRVVEHVAMAKDAGVLSGLIFSGVGGGWVDNHLPFALDAAPRHGDHTSLLTLARLRAAVTAAGEVDILGFKMRPAPGPPALNSQVAEAVAVLSKVSGRGLRVEVGV